MFKSKLSATIWSYIAGVYAYDVAFLCNQYSSLEPAQLILLLFSPITWPLHMGLVLLCTFSGGRGAWDQNNTISATVMAIVFVITYALIRIKQDRRANTPDNKLNPTTEGVPLVQD